MKKGRSSYSKTLLAEKVESDLIPLLILDGVLIVSGEQILYFNPIAEKIFGITPGAPFSNLLSDIKNANALKAIRQTLSQSLPIELAIQNASKPKNVYLFRCGSIPSELTPCVYPFRDARLIIAQDITLLREADEAKNYYLASLAHEIRTPVTSLTMGTRLLKRSVDQISNPIYKNLILSSADDVDRLRTLLEDLIGVARHDAVSQEFKFQLVDFGKLLQHLVTPLQLLDKEIGISLQYDFVKQGSSLLIEMDATKVTWAMSDLITKALHCTSRGGNVGIEIKDCTEWVEVKIQNSGFPVTQIKTQNNHDSAPASKVVQHSQSEQNEDLDSDLARAQEIIQVHHGKISISREFQQGAEIRFMLPVRRSTPQRVKEEKVYQLKLDGTERSTKHSL